MGASEEWSSAVIRSSRNILEHRAHSMTHAGDGMIALRIVVNFGLTGNTVTCRGAQTVRRLLRHGTWQALGAVAVGAEAPKLRRGIYSCGARFVQHLPEIFRHAASLALKKVRIVLNATHDKTFGYRPSPPPLSYRSCSSRAWARRGQP